MFVYREEYYVERGKPSEGTPQFQDWMAKMQQVSGKAEVIIGKQRHGPVGTVVLSFEGSFTRFGNLAQDQYLPERRE
jgi:replicative DNA helicase